MMKLLSYNDYLFLVFACRIFTLCVYIITDDVNQEFLMEATTTSDMLFGLK